MDCYCELEEEIDCLYEKNKRLEQMIKMQNCKIEKLSCNNNSNWQIPFNPCKQFKTNTYNKCCQPIFDPLMQYQYQTVNNSCNKELKSFCEREIILYYPLNTITNNNITYYNVVNPNAINPQLNVTKFPCSIKSCVDISCDIYTTNTGELYYILPNDNNTYYITFSAELKISTETSITSYGSINYLSGSSVIAANPQPAIVNLIFAEETCNVITPISNINSQLQLTWNNVQTNPGSTLLPPSNFIVFQEPFVSGLPGSYYKANNSTSCFTYEFRSLQNNCSKRLISASVTSGFSFSAVKIKISRNK